MRIISDRGICIIQKNEAGPLWITSLLLNTVTEFYEVRIHVFIHIAIERNGDDVENWGVNH